MLWSSVTPPMPSELAVVSRACRIPPEHRENTNSQGRDLKALADAVAVCDDVFSSLRIRLVKSTCGRSGRDPAHSRSDGRPGAQRRNVWDKHRILARQEPDIARQ